VCVIGVTISRVSPGTLRQNKRNGFLSRGFNGGF